MLFVEREQERDGQKVEPSRSWFTAAAATTARALEEREAHEVTDLYRDDRVRAPLEALFGFKCAYCESRIGPANGMDVEHYRPKGAVAERDDHPGYYWLAYEWTNLYPSCQLCNQRRRDNPTFDDPATLAAAGKLDQFPLADEAHRAMGPEADLAQESPLLLDPCATDPEAHITFSPITGEALAIDENDLLANTTIKVCNLNRRRLKKARLLRIREAWDLIHGLKDSVPEAPDAVLRRAVVSALGGRDKPYSACIKAVFADPDALG